MKRLLMMGAVAGAIAAGATTTVLPYGDVRLKGPMGERLNKMIEHHLKATDVDYITAPFLEKTERGRRWQTEFWGKFMHAAMPFWTYTQDPELRRHIDFGFERMAGALSRKFGGEWTLLVRLHRWTRGVKIRTAGGSVVDATDYPDMQELIVVAEAGITDFSSWIFDYVVTGRPGFIFASGAERYAAATGLCYPLEESPFPVAYDAETLFANVAAFDEAAYAGRVKEFLDRMECVDDGRSAERVADWLEKLPAKEGA